MRRHPSLCIITFLLIAIASGCSDRPRGGASNAMPDTMPTASADTTQVATPQLSCDSAPAAGSRLLCPHRVGAIGARTTRTSLDSMFHNMRDTRIDTGEGDMEAATIVNSGGQDSAIVIWRDSTRSHIQSVANIGPAWRTTDGLGVGSTLQEITNKIGTPQVLGFGWDYGGTLMLTGTSLENSGIFFRMEPAATVADSIRDRIRGDHPFPSDDPGIDAMKLYVRRIDVFVE